MKKSTSNSSYSKKRDSIFGRKASSPAASTPLIVRPDIPQQLDDDTESVDLSLTVSKDPKKELKQLTEEIMRASSFPDKVPLFQDILENKRMLDLMLRWSKTQFCGEALLFFQYVKALDEGDQLSKDTSERAAMIRDIAKKFIGRQAIFEVNVSGQNATRVQGLLDEAADDNEVCALHPGLYESCVKEACHTVEQDIYPNFLKFLSDVIRRRHFESGERRIGECRCCKVRNVKCVCLFFFLSSFSSKADPRSCERMCWMCE